MDEEEDCSEPEVDPLLGTDYDGEEEVSGDFGHVHGDELDVEEPLHGLSLSPQLMADDSTPVILEQSTTPVSRSRLSAVVKVEALQLMELKLDHDGADGAAQDADDGEAAVFEIESNGPNEKQILLFEELSEFMEWESNPNGCGLRIKAMADNEFGRALSIESGLEAGWQITIIDGDNIGKKMRVYILNRIQKCNANKGYHVTFERTRKEEKSSVLKPSVYKKGKKAKSKKRGRG